MPALLGDGFHLKEGVSQLMGVSLHIFRNKVKGQIDVGKFLTLVLLNPIYLAFSNSVDPDQLASEEAN